ERPHQKIGSILVEINALSEEFLVELLSIQLGLERFDPQTSTIDAQFWQESKWLRANELLPIGRRNGAVVVAFADPLNHKQLKAAQKVFGKDIIIGIAGKREIHSAIDRLNTQKPK